MIIPRRAQCELFSFSISERVNSGISKTDANRQRTTAILTDFSFPPLSTKSARKTYPISPRSSCNGEAENNGRHPILRFLALDHPIPLPFNTSPSFNKSKPWWREAKCPSTHGYMPPNDTPLLNHPSKIGRADAVGTIRIQRLKTNGPWRARPMNPVRPGWRGSETIPRSEEGPWSCIISNTRLGFWRQPWPCLVSVSRWNIDTGRITHIPYTHLFLILIHFPSEEWRFHSRP